MIYLDNAATSFPKPPRVYEELRRYLEEYGGCPGRGSHELARRTEGVMDDTRRLLAQLFGAPDMSRIIFTLNATDALNMAIKGVVRPGDHVVTTVLEHNSVARPLNRLEHKGLIRVTRVAASREGLIDPGDIHRALTPRTRLVSVVHGSNVTGAIQPVDRIGPLVRKAGALFLVDASQTAGAVPIDVEAMAIDLLAFPGHKALLGPPGTGGLYVGPRAELEPWREGGTGVQSEAPLQPDTLPLHLEAGSPNTLGVAGLRESLRFIQQYGVPWIRTHELALTRRLLEGLQAIDRVVIHGPAALEQRVAVVSITVREMSVAAMAERLDRAHHIAVRSGLLCAPGTHRALGTFPDGTLRISPGYFTLPADITACLAAIREAVEQQQEAPVT